MKRKIILGAVALSALSCVVVIGLYFHLADRSVIASIYVDDEVLYQVNLTDVTETTTLTFGEEGAQNVVEISPEGIGVIQADCPDQTCVHQGIRAHGPAPIVCLPHNLSIRFSESGSEDVDLVTGTGAS